MLGGWNLNPDDLISEIVHLTTTEPHEYIIFKENVGGGKKTLMCNLIFLELSHKLCVRG